MKRFAMFIFVVLMLCVGVAMVRPGNARAAIDPRCDASLFLPAPAGIPSWYQYLEVGPDGGDPCAIKPFPGDSSFDWGKALPRVGLAVVDILLRVAALVAVGFTVYGGIRYILSQGQPDATKKAKGTIIGASVGLVITMFAATIVGFIGAMLWK